jgi:hypothetical protein
MILLQHGKKNGLAFEDVIFTRLDQAPTVPT